MPEQATRTAQRATWLGVLVLLLTLNGALLVHKVETYPFSVPVLGDVLDLRLDPVVDRSRIASNVYQDLKRAGLPAGANLRFWSPTAVEMGRAAGLDPSAETYWEANVRNALLGGLAVRVMLPQVKSVEFVRSLQPTGDSTLYAVYQVDGHLTVARTSDLDSLRRASTTSP